jgi:hypothetical protein
MPSNPGKSVRIENQEGTKVIPKKTTIAFLLGAAIPSPCIAGDGTEWLTVRGLFFGRMPGYLYSIYFTVRNMVP